jgi:hypothetical protein
MTEIPENIPVETKTLIEMKDKLIKEKEHLEDLADVLDKNRNNALTDLDFALLKKELSRINKRDREAEESIIPSSEVIHSRFTI